jgi:hypothetical protein
MWRGGNEGSRDNVSIPKSLLALNLVAFAVKSGTAISHVGASHPNQSRRQLLQENLLQCA